MRCLMFCWDCINGCLEAILGSTLRFYSYALRVPLPLNKYENIDRQKTSISYFRICSTLTT